MLRPICLALALALSACASAPPPAAPPAITFDHTALHVADLDASVAFYERVFGFREIAAPGDPAVIRWLAVGPDEQLHLIAFDGAVPPTTKALHFALRTPDLDGLVAHVERLGIPYSDWPGAASTLSLRPDGIRQIYVQDPDGYWIEVNDVAP